MYIPSCPDCQRNKSPTRRRPGPLHPLPVPDAAANRLQLIPLDRFRSMTYRLDSDLHIVASRTDISAEDLTAIFFRGWYCENGLPLEIASDRDKLHF